MSPSLGPTPAPNSPVIVGVGQFLNRSDEPLDPVALAAEAARAAAEDCGRPKAVEGVDAIAVVPIVSWRYGDPGPAVGAAVGAAPSLTMYPAMGGNTPQMLMNRICERIVSGEISSALLCGGEAYRTRMRHRRADE